MAWWTGLCILLALFGSWVIVSTGDAPWYLMVVMALSVPALGVWFRIRVAGHVFVVVNTFCGILGIAALFLVPFSWRMVFRVVMSFATAHSALEWTRRILLENEMLDEGLCWDDIVELMQDQEELPDESFVVSIKCGGFG